MNDIPLIAIRVPDPEEAALHTSHLNRRPVCDRTFLKDLADKTRRGLRGRIEVGHSGGGNSYGYDVIRRLGADGEPVTGERSIKAGEASVIRRMFEEFADGRSPKAIAHRLNDEQIPGPRGELWRDTAIRGHRIRGTGLLNNELYVGHRIWNRLRYVKDPDTGRRVSRLNPHEEWIFSEVPELRIIDDSLWEKVKARQAEIDNYAAVTATKATRFWEKRRQTHLLTGLLRCGRCGGDFAAVGRDYIACSAARKLRTCAQRQSFRRGVLEQTVLDLLRNRLMQPDAVAAFIKAFAEEVNARSGVDHAARARSAAERAKIARKLDGFYDAIAEGIRTQGLQGKLEELEARLARLDAELAAPAPSPLRLHPNLSELYRRKTAELAATLADPDVGPSAIDALRSLIERVTIDEGPEGTTLDIEGALAAMIGLAQNDKTRSKAGSTSVR